MDVGVRNVGEPFGDALDFVDRLADCVVLVDLAESVRVVCRAVPGVDPAALGDVGLILLSVVPTWVDQSRPTWNSDKTGAATVERLLQFARISSILIRASAIIAWKPFSASAISSVNHSTTWFHQWSSSSFSRMLLMNFSTACVSLFHAMRMFLTLSSPGR